MKNLPPILSKAAPFEELAILLAQKFLQVHRRSVANVDKNDMECFFMAIIIYLFVSDHSLLTIIRIPSKWSFRSAVSLFFQSISTGRNFIQTAGTVVYACF